MKLEILNGILEQFENRNFMFDLERDFVCGFEDLMSISAD